MILQRLTELYERLAVSEDPAQRAPAPGWKDTEIAFVIELASDGRPVNVVALRQRREKGRPRAPRRIVPQEAKRPGKIADKATEDDCWKASLFWDSARYALGVASGTDAKAQRDAHVCHELFRMRHRKFARDAGQAVGTDPGMRAMLSFLAEWHAGKSPPALSREIEQMDGNVAFQLAGDHDLICLRPVIRDAISATALAVVSPVAGQCLVTGQTTRIARLHPAIHGVMGAQASGANIVSFNEPAFQSHGLTQGENAPVGVYAAFAYTTVLNMLLREGSRFRARAGATTLLFWAANESDDERSVGNLMVEVAEESPPRNVEAVGGVYKAPLTGIRPINDAATFFILGLSAESKSRLTVRFFHEDTITRISRTIQAWFDAMDLATEGPPLSLALLRRGLAAPGDPKHVPLALETGLASAAYTGGPLPYQVLSQVLKRCAADRGVTRERMALIKAFLIRNERRNVTVALDPDEPDPAYRLGRLFAVLEWIQLRAINARAGVADQYWGLASSTPAYVFPELLKLAVFHLAKLDGLPPPWPGFAVNRRKDIDAIMEGLPPMLPRRLELIDQGTFAVGYWHQSALRRRVAETPSPADDTAAEMAA